MPALTLSDEVTYESGIDANGKVAATTFFTWHKDPDSNPATYDASSDVGKWGTATAGTSGGTVQYYFNPASNWTATQQAAFTDVFALWSAVANISFTLVTSAPADGITITRGNDGGANAAWGLSGTGSSGTVGEPTTWTITSPTISIDTRPPPDGFGPIDGSFSTEGGYLWTTMLHEVGHSIGLGHTGPYDEGDGITPDSAQYSVYDTRLYSVMSYIEPNDATGNNGQYPVTGTNWGYTVDSNNNIWGDDPTTWMPLDILAAQRLYGTPTSTPLSGGQTFGFNESGFSGTAGLAIAPFFDFTKNTSPIITIFDTGTGNTLDLSGFTTNDTVNLNPGTYSSAGTDVTANGHTVNYMVNNIAIAYGTAIDNVVTGSGNDTITGNNDGDIFHAGTGSNTIYGGTGVDTVVMLGAQASYTITHNGNGSVTVAKSGESDTLWNVENISFGTKPSDFDGDGKSDFLFLNTNGQPAIWLMNGATPTTQANVGVNPGASWLIAGSGDFDGDGKADILFQNLNGQPAIWLMNGTTPTSQVNVGTNPGTSWHVIAAGDFNGDGKSDILWQNASGQIAIYLMNGTTPTSQVNVGTNPGSDWHAVGTGDFNGDGKADILFQNTSGQVAIWLMNGTTPTSQLNVGTNPGANIRIKGVGDFDGDGKSDILFQNTNGKVAIWLMNGTTPTTQVDVGSNPGPVWQAINSGDFNGDGKSDILFQNLNGQAALWLMNGTTVSSAVNAGTNAGTGWHIVNDGVVGSAYIYTHGDVNADGDGDFLFQNDSGQVAIWTMNGTTPVTQVNVGPNPGTSLKVIADADFDGGGRADILFQNTSSGKVGMWLMSGTTVALQADIAVNPGVNLKAIGAGDFNADGNADILFQNTNGEAGVWLMDGTTVVTQADVGANPGTSWHVIAAGDFNGDGYSDILWQNDSGQAAIYLMNGTTVTSAVNVGTNPGSSWHAIAARDFNGDGKADILWQNTSGAVAIWLMNGTTPTAQADIGTNPGASWVVKGAEDLNGDGNADIIFQNSSGQAAAYLMSGTTILSAVNVGTNPGAAWHIIAAGG